LLYSELDDNRWEVWKVEVFPDQSIGLASKDSNSKKTRLGEVSLPSVEEIAADLEFKPEEISSADFELVWRNRFRKDLPN